MLIASCRTTEVMMQLEMLALVFSGPREGQKMGLVRGP